MTHSSRITSLKNKLFLMNYFTQESLWKFFIKTIDEFLMMRREKKMKVIKVVRMKKGDE